MEGFPRLDGISCPIDWAVSGPEITRTVKDIWSRKANLVVSDRFELSLAS